VCRRANRRQIRSILWVISGTTYVREDGGGETSDYTGSKGDSDVLWTTQVGLCLGAHLVVDELGTSLVNGELTCRV
jgi:hypothetical protein